MVQCACYAPVLLLLFLEAHTISDILNFPAQGVALHCLWMPHLAQVVNQIKQEAGIATLPLGSCVDAGKCGSLYTSMKW